MEGAREKLKEKYLRLLLNDPHYKGLERQELEKTVDSLFALCEIIFLSLSGQRGNTPAQKLQSGS